MNTFARALVQKYYQGVNEMQVRKQEGVAMDMTRLTEKTRREG